MIVVPYEIIWTGYDDDDDHETRIVGPGWPIDDPLIVYGWNNAEIGMTFSVVKTGAGYAIVADNIELQSYAESFFDNDDDPENPYALSTMVSRAIANGEAIRHDDP